MSSYLHIVSHHWDGESLDPQLRNIQSNDLFDYDSKKLTKTKYNLKSSMTIAVDKIGTLRYLT